MGAILSLEQALAIAQQSADYANTKITQSSNKTPNNEIDDTLVEKWKNVRNKFKYKHHYFRFIRNKENVAKFETEVTLSAKNKIGNCQVLTFQSLDYILNNYPTICAEAYWIDGGDHAFLVLNRKPYSDPANPDTWGDNAVICDPWANEHQVYPSAEYKTKLRNFCLNLEKRKLGTEPFNPRKHKLKPYTGFSTQALGDVINLENLQKKFFTSLDKMKRLMKEYKEKLENEEQRLDKKYGQSDKKTKMIKNKINKIEKLNLELNRIKEKYKQKEIFNDQNYRSAKKNT